MGRFTEARKMSKNEVYGWGTTRLYTKDGQMIIAFKQGELFPTAIINVGGHETQFTYFKARKLLKTALKMLNNHNDFVEQKSRQKALKAIAEIAEG